MGFITANDLTEGISGRVGNKIVFRTVRGVTIAKQATHRENYIQALMYTRENSDLTIFRNFIYKQHIKLLETELDSERKIRSNDGLSKCYSFLF